MLYKRLFIQVIIRIILIIGNVLLMTYLFLIDKFIATQINLLILLIAQACLLVYYLNKTNRELSLFFSSITNNDSTIVFKRDEKNKSYTKLYENLNKVNQVIEQAKIEKEGQFEYLKQVVENVGIGIISFNDNLDIQFFNPAGKDILRINKIKNLKDLDKIYPGFSYKLQSIKTNTQRLISIKNNNNELDLSVKLVTFKLSGNTIKLIAFQDIQTELDKKEVESWQKIIRVLTHEIMNSVSPINSATNSLSKLFKKDNTPINPKDINKETIQKTIKGMNIIEQRSKGMLDFVQQFRDLTLIPEPKKEKIKVQELFQIIETLYSKELKEKSIKYQFSVPNYLTIDADKPQIEQILINLVKNAIEGVETAENPQIPE